jgi:energy-coupling factor transport system permease protein
MHQLAYTWRDRNAFLAVVLITAALAVLYIYFK